MRQIAASDGTTRDEDSPRGVHASDVYAEPEVLRTPPRTNMPPQVATPPSRLRKFLLGKGAVACEPEFCTPSRAPPQCLADGYLHKLAATVAISHWSRRYVALTPTQLLYADDGDSLRRKCYPLRELENIHTVGDRKLELKFEERTLTFMAADNLSRDFWFSAITRAHQTYLDSQEPKSRIGDLAQFLDRNELKYGSPTADIK